jgi:hypothetical protein
MSLARLSLSGKILIPTSNQMIFAKRTLMETDIPPAFQKILIA